MNIKLRFINRSTAANNPKVVIFQRNIASSLRELAVAWKVIEHCSPGCFHPFTYSTRLGLSTSDAYGNHTPVTPIELGQVYSVSPTPFGRHIRRKKKGDNCQRVVVRNDLIRGAINVNIYSNGQILATKTTVVPEQKALFEFSPTLWIGVASDVEQGQFLNSEVLSDVNTEIPLLGVASADIVMTGGGSGTHAEPLVFELENVIGIDGAPLM